LNLAIGTAQFGLDYGISNFSGKVNLDEAKEIIRFAQKSGINTIDTARDYGDSEESIGKCDVSSFNVVTKIGTILGNEDNISNWVELEIESSIKKLRLQKIYGILLHRPHELLLENGDVLYESIMKLKENRLVEKIGVSVYSINDLMNIVDRFNIDIVQLPINIINQEILHSGFLQELKSKNIEIHARSCFLQGLLLMDFNDIPLKFKKWSNIFLDWRDWLDENNINAVQGCLSFINSIDGIDKVVVGVENVNQLKELVDYSNTTKGIKTFPNLSCNDVNLIDPSNWNSL
jgi:aryl-alcohol dehydrogenase-like predicted oxidoreductase